MNNAVDSCIEDENMDQKLFDNDDFRMITVDTYTTVTVFIYIL